LKLEKEITLIGPITGTSALGSASTKIGPDFNSERGSLKLL